MKSIKELLEFSIINIDKPSGPTSFQISDYVREKLQLKKTGHLGTLDPAVSGVLPIALNRACKISEHLMRKDKVYYGIMRLHENIEEKELKEIMKEFIGKITQLPPVRSSVKREKRERRVNKFEFIEKESKDVLFMADVEAGTYIRTLINDLGKKIGGAHMLELRRTSAGIFVEKDSWNLYDFLKAVELYNKGDESQIRKMIIPAEEVIKKNLQIIKINDLKLKEIFRGKPIHKVDIISMPNLEKDQYAAVFSGEKFVEIARVVNKDDTIAVPDFVLN